MNVALASKLRARIVRAHGQCLLNDDELLRIYERDGGRSDSAEAIEAWFSGQTPKADAGMAPLVRVDAAPAPAPKAPAKRRDPVREAWDASWRSDAANPTEQAAEMHSASKHVLASHLQHQAQQTAEHNRQLGRGNLLQAAFEASFHEFDRRQEAAANAEHERGHGGTATKDPVAEAYKASWRRDGS